MTSSLVGSEMCIRDSQTQMEDIHWQAYPAKKIYTPQTLIKSRTTIPVSYTHLTLPTICSV
eukprot:2423142-Prorocentrum_lima.AAC.1